LGEGKTHDEKQRAMQRTHLREYSSVLIKCLTPTRTCAIILGVFAESTESLRRSDINTPVAGNRRSTDVRETL